MRSLVSAGFLLLSVAHAHAGETPKALVVRMTDEKATWKQRADAEDKLTTLSAREVLPLLIPHIAKGMPEGGIYNSAGREHDKEAAPVWQVHYAVDRSWTSQVNKLKDGELLHDLLKQSPPQHAKWRLVHDLAQRWTPNAEPALAGLLKDPKENLSVRITAGVALILEGKENYHENLLRFAAQSGHEDRIRWHELLVDPRHKTRRGMDPRVLAMSFELVNAELKRSPDYIHGAYFIVTRTGHYLGQKFNPNQNDPRYQGEGRLKDAFFRDTVNNAIAWWEQNKNNLKATPPTSEAVPRRDSPGLSARRPRPEQRLGRAT